MPTSELTQEDKEHPVSNDTSINADQALGAPVVGVNEVVIATSKAHAPSNVQKISPFILRALLIIAVLVAIRYTPTLTVFALMALMSYGGARGVVRRMRDGYHGGA